MSFYGNTATCASHSSLRAGDARGPRHHNSIGPSRTRLANRHNPYAATVSQQDTDAKGQRRNRREGCLRPPTKRPSTVTADAAVATASGSWEGASQDATYFQLPKSTPLPLPPAPAMYRPECAQARASTSTLPPPSPRLVAQDMPLDEFGLYSSLRYEDNYGSTFFDSFNLGCSTSYQEQQAILSSVEETLSPSPTLLPEPARRSAGRINLSSLHYRVMRSKGYVPDISLDQLDGVVRKRILRQADRLMFEHQAQSREQRKWRGYREPEDGDLLKRSKKRVRFNPCSTDGRNKKRLVSRGVDELVHQVSRIHLST